jgi:hypothetical protein
MVRRRARPSVNAAIFSVVMASRVENNGSMFSFMLGCVWLICGVGLLVYQALSPDRPLTMHVAGTSISPGWIMLVLSAYNFIRWWSRRAPRSVPRDSPAAYPRQRIRRIEEPTERDPNFIFTDDPPPPPPPPLPN